MSSVPQVSFARRRAVTGLCFPTLIGFILGALTVMFVVPEGDTQLDANAASGGASLHQLMRDIFTGQPSDTAGGGKRYKSVYNTGSSQGAHSGDTGDRTTQTDKRRQDTENQQPSPDAAPLQSTDADDTSSSTSSSTSDTTPATGDASGDDVPDYLINTAIVTMATGDASAKDAIALMQSLRDVGTRVPNLIVMLSRGGVGSADCNNNTWKKEMGREQISCAFYETIAPEIASQKYLDGYARLNVQAMVVNPIPETEFTKGIAGKQNTVICTHMP
jgi:hypothetical protein